MTNKIEIISAFEDFMKDEGQYHLCKLESSARSNVHRGAWQMGTPQMFGIGDQIMIAIVSNDGSILKTSPVVEIIKVTGYNIEFKTESDSIYVLSK